MKLHQCLAAAALAIALIAPATAQPFLTVTPAGFNLSGNRLWIADVFPDPDLFSDNPPNGIGGSVALEMAFKVVGSDIVSIVKNDANFPEDNPGDNPFTGTETNGIVITPPDSGNVFTALGSTYFTTAGPHEVFTLETAGGAMTTVFWGEAASEHPVLGARIAQAATNYDGQTGMVTAVPEPATMALAAIALTALGMAFRRR